MNRYDPKTPRKTFVVVAVAMGVLTIGVLVVLPAKMDFDSVDARALAAGKATSPAPTLVVINPSRIEVVGERDKKVAMADEAMQPESAAARQQPPAARQQPDGGGARARAAK